MLLASSGIHANGLSLARKLVERLPQGYLTEVRARLDYGDALLAPTVLYSPVTEALYQAGITPHYCANITGHGWRKLLRHPAAHLPHHTRAAGDAGAEVHPAAGAAGRPRGLQHAGHGRGLRAVRRGRDAQRTVEVAQAQGVDALVAGQVEAGPKQLLIEPLGIRFGNDDLQLR